MSNSSFNNVIISRTALVDNYLSLKEKLSASGTDLPMLAMIKADAYGHGAVEVAKTLSAAGCDVFGVGELREAIILREADITGDIFVMMGFGQDDADLFFRYNITPVVFSLDDIYSLATVAEKLDEEIGIYLKVDTGMGRLGFRIDEIIEVARSASKMFGIKIAGMVSHFAEADDPSAPSNVKAIELFTDLTKKLKAEFSVSCHLVNSAGVLNFPTAYFDMGRAGISLYGYHPAGEQNLAGLELKPVMSFKTKILQVKQHPAGTGISYGHLYTTKTTEKIAVLPVGYEDGFNRLLSNKAEVLIGGKRAPVRGRICMNLCMVDVSHIENVSPGDEVVILGSQGAESISAYEIANWAGTISYEILCMFGHTNNKKYV